MRNRTLVKKLMRERGRAREERKRERERERERERKRTERDIIQITVYAAMSEVGRQIFSPETMGPKKPVKEDKAYQLMKEELNRTLEALNGTMANSSIVINWKEIFGTADAPNYVEVNDAHREVSFIHLLKKSMILAHVKL